MKKQLWMVSIPLALSIVLTGCNVISGAQAEVPTASARPLDPAAWPTPQPNPTLASPTPFPRITLAPDVQPPNGTATPTPNATIASTASAASGTGAETEAFSFTGNLGELVQQVTNLSGGFPPVAAATVKAADATVRQGPADSYAEVGLAKQGEIAAVLGKNDAGDWLYVLTRSTLQGWLPTDALQITLSLGAAPVLPPDPPRTGRQGRLAQKPPEVASTASSLTNLLGEYEPVAVALVTAKGVTLRQGPAASYPVAEGVEQGELAGVLGTNAGRDWLYVITISGVQGWLPADNLRVMGSLAEAAVLPANPLAAAPIAPASPSASPAGPSGSAPGAAGSQPLPITELAPIAKAQVDNDSLNLRQGPGAAYELLGTLSRGTEVSLVALNKTRDWTLVKTSDGHFGWVSLNYLAVDGSLADAPEVISPAPSRSLPPGQVAPIFPLSLESNAATTSGDTGAIQPGVNTTQAGQVSTSSPAPAPDFIPVATARANQPETILYRGPGTKYEPIVTLSSDEASSVLALNQQGDWALVKPTDSYKSPGWVPVEHLSVGGSLANAPRIITAWVESNALPVQRGPGLYYDQIGTLTIHDLVAVLGVNQGRNWALVKPVLGGGQGWIPLNFLTLMGSWSEVPLAPEPPLVAENAVSGQTAPAAPRTGTVVLQLSSGGDIVSINPDGTGLRRLTQGIDPVLSPDGQTVAFTRWTGEDGTLWLVGVDGSHERAVLGETKQAKHPSWSPDGQRVVVNFQHGGRLDPKQICENLTKLGNSNPGIPFNVDPDTVEVKLKDNQPYLCWTLPPDPHWGLRVVKVADSSYEDMPSDSYTFGPEWDPATPWRIISSGLNGLVQLDVNRAAQWALTNRGEDHTPAFSPDGRYIAVAFNNNGQYDIHRLNSDGNGRVALTQTPLWVTAEAGEQKPWNNVAPAWSPDGSQIAFLSDRTGRWEIWVMNADGSHQRAMFADQVNDQLDIHYEFVDERVLSWR